MFWSMLDQGIKQVRVLFRICEAEMLTSGRINNLGGLGVVSAGTIQFKFIKKDGAMDSVRWNATRKPDRDDGLESGNVLELKRTARGPLSRAAGLRSPEPPASERSGVPSSGDEF